MKTSNFEVQFLMSLRDHIETRYPGLVFISPRAERSAFSEAPSPDVIVKNPATGGQLAIEIKGGASSSSVPSALVPKLKAMKAFGLASMDGGEHTPVWLVSTATVPPAMKSVLKDEDIHVVQSDTVEGALRSLDSPLFELEQGSRPVDKVPKTRP
jgi:hypothetical protein